MPLGDLTKVMLGSEYQVLDGFLAFNEYRIIVNILNMQAYRPPENPKGRRRHLFLQPTIYKWKVIKTKERDGVRIMELNKENATVCQYSINISSIRTSYKSSLYFPDEGGIHLTSHAFLPSALLKELSATEDQFYSGNFYGYVLSTYLYYFFDMLMS